MSIIRKNWNDKEIAALQLLVAQGKSADEIARILGRNADSIFNKCKKLKLRLRARLAWSEKKIAEFKENAKIMNQKELAEHYNRSRQNIKYHCDKLGITPIRHKAKFSIQDKKEPVKVKVNTESNLMYQLWDKRKNVE
jgi:hypothetical protein